MYSNIRSGIYVWTSPSGKNYVGQATNLAKRKHDFVRPNKKYAGVAIENARRRYSDFTKWRYQVLEECEKELLNEREEYWVEYYDSHNPRKGYNLTLGGGGNSGYMETDEVRQKISNALKGKYKGELNPRFGKKLTAEQKECIRYNTKHGAGAWQKIKAEEEAARLAEEERLRQKAERARRHKIMSIDIETGEVERFDSVHKAVKKYQYHKESIFRVLRGTTEKAYGKYWTYQDEDLQKEQKDRREEHLSKCKRKPAGYWSIFYNCKKESEKYTDRTAFYNGNQRAYHSARKNGWLNDFFPKAA